MLTKQVLTQTEADVRLQAALPAGFTTRPARLEQADFQTVAEFITKIEIDELGRTTPVPASEIEHEWTGVGFDPQVDIRLVFDPQGMLCGYLEVWANRKPAVHPFIWGRVLPEFRDRGIGSAILAWGEWRASHVLDELPEDVRVSFLSGFVDGDQYGHALLSDNGYSIERYFLKMEIGLEGVEIPAPQWSDGLELRPYRHPEDALAVYRVVRDSFRDHYGYIPEEEATGFPRWSHHFFPDEKFDPAQWLLVWDGDKLAAVSLNRIEAYDAEDTGYINTLGVLREYRKRGIALALLYESFRRFQAIGKPRCALNVDAENLTGALRLYEKAGMRAVRRYVNYEKEIRPGRELTTQ